MLMISNFAVFEGGDGSGTTTQIEIVRRRFDSLRRVHTQEPSFAGEPCGGAADSPKFALPSLYNTFEPTGGAIGQMIRSALRGESSLRAETMAMLFAADRNEHLYGAGGIVERCRRGELVISDRYVPSSLVYQGINCGEELPALLNGSFPAPELLVFLDIDPELAQKRLESRKVKDIYEYLEFQIQVREMYKTLLPCYREQGVRVEIIDAAGTQDEVAEEVWRALEKMPILKGKGNGNEGAGMKEDKKGETTGKRA